MSVAEDLGRPAVAVGKGTLSVLFVLGTTFILVVLFLLEGPKLRRALLDAVPPERSAWYQRVGAEISRSLSGYVLGDFLTSLVAGVVVFVTLELVSVPYALIWAVWVALGRLSPFHRGCARRYTDGAVCLDALCHRGGNNGSCLSGLPTGRKPFAEPCDHEPDGQGQPTARSGRRPHRCRPRQLARRDLCRVCGRFAGCSRGGVAQVVTKEIWSATSPAKAQAQDGGAPTDKLSG